MPPASRLLFLAFFAVFFCSSAAKATSIVPPPCPDIADRFISDTSLVNVLAKSTSQHAYYCAASAIEERRDSATAIWLALLNHRESRLRALAFEQLSPRVPERIFSLDLPALEQNNLPPSAVRHYIELAAEQGAQRCGGVLGYSGDAGRAAIARLTVLLSDKKPEVRKAASSCLAALGPQARQALPVLIRSLRGQPGNGGGNDVVVEDLARIGIYRTSDFDALVDFLAHKPATPVPELAYVDVVDFSPLPPGVMPRLAALAKQAQTDMRKSPTPLKHVYEQRNNLDFSWLSIALANTHTAAAAALLAQDQAYDAMAATGPAAVPLLIDRLARGPQTGEKIEIIAALHRIGTPNAKVAAAAAVKQVLPALLADLKVRVEGALPILASRSEPSLRSVERFKTLGALARDARQPLLTMLQSPDIELRSKAARALAYILAFDAEPTLIAMRDKSRAPGDTGQDEQDGRKEETRVFNIAIGALRSAPDYLATRSIEQLASMAAAPHVDYVLTRDAIAALAARAERALPSMMKVLAVWNARHKANNTTSLDYATSAVLPALGAMGSQASAGFPQLLRYLNDAELGFALGSSSGEFYLARAGIRTPQLMEQLLDQIVHNDSASGRWYSAQVLGDLAPIPAAMQPALRRALAQPALWTHDGGKPPDSLIFALTGKHQDAEAPTNPKYGTAQLVRMIVKQGGCVDGYFEIGTDPCTDMQKHGSAGVAAMLPLLAHGYADIRQAASDFLGSMGPQARKALPQLSLLLHDRSLLVRRVTADNVGRITGHDNSAPEYTAYLLHALGGKNDDERITAALHLGQFSRLPATSITALRKALKHPRLQDFQEPLLHAIASTGGEEGVTALMDLLHAARGDSERVRVVAALGQAGPGGIAALIAHSYQRRDQDQLIALANGLAAQKPGQARARAQAIIKRLLPQLTADLAAADTAQTWHIDKRRSAARRLAAVMRHSPQAVKIGMDNIDHVDRHIRATLIAGLGDGAGPELLPRLAVLMQHRDTLISTHATDAASRIRVRHASPYQRWKQCIGPLSQDIDLKRCKNA